ncbi:Hsp70 family protein [Streptomyces sp. MJP52]|uniref:Hsp70 family protein n=1 Tax=Streptomyces sp. MJP52 TaxID=2940555 RepID=UPI0024760CD7|nr:Hsp70 family protein [Streptomyces sp. MJP52]MDH6223279.1 molecular chaperone DnaK [Streptomyces sp. MJP52]
MHRTLGIDLGTTNSVVAWLEDGEPKVVSGTEERSGMPSAVGLTLDGGLLVGEDALDWVERDATRVMTTVKRLMGRQFKDEKVQKALRHMGDGGPEITEGPDGGVLIRLGEHRYSPVHISAIILRRLKRDAEARLETEFRRAVITAPAYFGERQIAATREAGRLAGFHVVRVLSEPTAAALAHGLGRAKNEDPATVLVYDLGGGTFDVSVFTLMPGGTDELGTGGDNLLGGTDFDSLLARHLQGRLAARHPGHEALPDEDAKFRQAAERAKIALSAASATEVILTPLGVTGETFSETVSREVLEELISDRIENTVRLTLKTLADASLCPEDMDQVLLVGGSSAIPLVTRRLADVFGHDKLRTDVDPMICVALGAAVESALVEDLECPECRAACPSDFDECAECATPLVGAPTVQCPACHIPAPEGTGACPVCATDLTGFIAERPTLPSAVCNTCQEVNDPGAVVCGLCGTALQDNGGLKCPDCGLVNRPGLVVCSYCDEVLPVAEPSGVIPQPIGLHTTDGLLTPLIAAGERYPTEQPVRHDFHVTGNAGDLLEIALFEGDLQPAERNELCGMVMYQLPEGITGAVPLTLAVELDKDRTIRLTTRLDGTDFARAIFRRNLLAPEFRRRAKDINQRFQTFLADWRGELTPAETAVLMETASALELIVRGEAPGRSLDTVLEEADDLLERQGDIRWASALAYLYPHHVADLMIPSDLEVLRRHRTELLTTRRAGDFVRGHSIAVEVMAIRKRLGDDLYRVMSALGFAAQNGVSPALQERIRQAGQGLTEAVKQGDYSRTDAAKSRIADLHREMRREQADFRAPARKTVRPAKPSS